MTLVKPGAERQVLDALLRSHFLSFVHKVFVTAVPGERFIPNWHIDAISHAAVSLIESDDPKLLITMPPRSLKSIIVSVALPAFLLGHDPTRKIVCVSYAEELAQKHARDFKAVVTSGWYRRLYPNMQIARATASEISTSRRGGRYATTVGGTLTGRGGSIFIIDDPIKPADALSKAKRTAVNDWFGSTLASRANDKRSSKTILVMQRVHVQDPAGIAIEAGTWRHLNLPAIAEHEQSVPIGMNRFRNRRKGEALFEAREPLPVLENLKREMGSFAFSAQYQQAPVPIDGALFKWSWFSTYDEIPQHEGEIVQSWDTAMSDTDHADWSVCTTWLVVGETFYLLNLFRDRLLYPDLKRKIIELNKRFEADLVIEDRGSGTSLIQDLRREGISAIKYLPKDDKIVRASRISAHVEGGQVFLPAKASWLDEFRTEILAFPNGAHDDQVDSMVQAIDWRLNRRTRVWSEPLMI